MYIGIPNPNVLIPLEKMTIRNLDTKQAEKKVIRVLYNPQTYTQMRNVSYSQFNALGSNGPVVQFQSGMGEVLYFELFFDSLSAGMEVGGSVADRASFAANSLLPSLANQIDVRKYTKKVYDLLEVEPTVHRPPRLKVEWASLQFQGYLASCQQQFLKFDENGKPVRAKLICQFIESLYLDKVLGVSPRESPDTTKYHRVRQGDSLWALSAAEYGQCSQWRVIAAANGMTNPRLLRTGDLIGLPALDEE